MQSLSTSLQSIQSLHRAGNSEAAGAHLKQLTGNVDSLVKAGKEANAIKGVDKIPKVFEDTLDESSLVGMHEFSDLQIGNSIHAEVFDRLTDFSKDITQSLEAIDLSAFSKSSSKKEPNSSPQQVKPMPKDDKFNSNFDGNRDNFDQNFFYTGQFNNARHALKHIQKHTKSMRNGFSFPKLSTIIIDQQQHDIVMAKHLLRQNAIGDVCLPQCNVTDVECNCRKLFSCVKRMDEYDLAV